MLILSRKVDESIIIGDDIYVSIVDIKGDQVKLGIQAPSDVKVYRHEVYEAIQKENVAAAGASAVLPEIKRLAGKKRPGAANSPLPPPAPRDSPPSK
jgi:carbon storage regulator